MKARKILHRRGWHSRLSSERDGLYPSLELRRVILQRVLWADHLLHVVLRLNIRLHGSAHSVFARPQKHYTSSHSLTRLSSAPFIVATENCAVTPERSNHTQPAPNYPNLTHVLRILHALSRREKCLNHWRPDLHRSTTILAQRDLQTCCIVDEPPQP